MAVPLEALRSFADPATEFMLQESQSEARCQLTRNGERMDWLSDPTGAVIARHVPNLRYKSVKSLVASPLFADLGHFAQTQLRLADAQQSDREAAPVIPIQFDWGNGPKPGTENDVEGNLEPEIGATRVLVLDGPAGIGKTSLIRRLVAARARRYRAADPVPLMLHVEATGSRLSALQDVIARVTQQARARFQFDQVATLVRLRLIDVAIDGFDELADADGYQNAWRALAEFFHDLQAQGACILSGRDTFLDDDRFRNAIERAAGGTASSRGWRVEPRLVRLHPPSPEAARDWIRERRQGPFADEEKPLIDELLRSGSFALRPFFLARIAEAKSLAALEGPPRVALMRAMEEREADKIRGSLRRFNEAIATENINSCLGALFEEIAADMADRESGEIESSALPFFADLAFEGILDSDDLAKIKYRISSIALLESGQLSGSRAFSNAWIQNYYLARFLFKYVKSSDILPTFMRRGILGLDFLEAFIDTMWTFRKQDHQFLFDRLLSCAERGDTFDRTPDNCYSIILSSLGRSDLDVPQTIKGVYATVAIIAGVAPNIVLKDGHIDRLDVTAADLSLVTFDGVKIGTIDVGTLTRFGEHLPDVHALRLVSDAEAGKRDDIVRTQAEIVKRMQTRSIDDQDLPANSKHLRLFDRVLRAMIRQHWIRLGADDEAARLTEDACWGGLRAVLVQHNLLIERNAPMSGPKSVLIGIQNPRRLLSPESDDSEGLGIRKAIAALG